jgi:hypothetical protein
VETFISILEGKQFPRFYFNFDFNENTIYEINLKGWLGYVWVDFEDGSRYPVFFYNPVSLAQEVERGQKWGYLQIAEPGMIVIPEITIENMKKSITRLIAENFFDHFKPLTQEPIPSILKR